MKKRIITIIALVAILALTTIGASAYFNSQRDTTGTITSGTLTLKLGLNAAGPWSSSVALPWNFSGMAPGETVTGDLWMINTGNIDAEQVTFEWHNIVDNSETVELAEHIFLTEVWDSKNTVDATAAVVVVADGITGLPKDGKASLSELAELSARYGFPFDATSDVAPFLEPNTPQFLHMAFQFDPAVGNEYQGLSMSYGLTIIAEQVTVFP